MPPLNVALACAESGEKDSTSQDPTLLIVLTVIPCVLAILLVSMAILMKQMRKRQMAPLVVMDSKSAAQQIPVAGWGWGGVGKWGWG